jgi:ketosteroid isomerase-like protein
MRLVRRALALLALAPACATCPDAPTGSPAVFAAPAPAPIAVGEDVATGIRRTLDAWHQAAADADEAKYFSYFAEDAVFLGTDATERWDLPAFRTYAHPHFARGKAWTLRAKARDVRVSDDGMLAWFDEELESEGLGPARGSGVLRRDAQGVYRIVHYNLSLTIPNGRFAAVREVLERPED